jgi:molybdenum cofactor synthesis domain-containing protein
VSELPADARAVVVTASNRASAGVYEDRSGQLLAEGLGALGFAVEGPHVRPDDADELARVLRAAVAGGADVVLTTGGTGLSPTDVTPEATRAVLEREAPGLAEAVRRYGAEKVPTSVLSRGTAGTAGRTLIVNLPGSTGGARDGLAVLGPLLPHVVSQLRGGDHADGDAGASHRGQEPSPR